MAGLSFSPHELADAIEAALPGFKIDYQPDERQQIAASWPHSIDDSQAGADWGWKARVGLTELVTDMLEHVQPQPSDAPAPPATHAPSQPVARSPARAVAQSA